LTYQFCRWLNDILPASISWNKSISKRITFVRFSKSFAP
jgi:hypothetical protein